MKTTIDGHRFGPWALITGASSGLGREFARQVAASGIHVVLAARRAALLEEVGRECVRDFGVQYRTVVADLSAEGFLRTLETATEELDIGLVISNAGTANPGELVKREREELMGLLRLNAVAHLEIAHHFGRRLARRGRGGILLCGAMGAWHGIPYLANESGAKAFVQSFGESLHVELQPRGVTVTVLVVGPTLTPVVAKMGLDPEQMPMKLMSAERCVAEGLEALGRNRASHLPGRRNRLMAALMPTALSRRLMGRMMAKAVARRARPLERTA